ncbi:MAG: undecaprenyl-diphosphate phosphatase [Candidatus Endonucleobacter bathymodioli]|uniref:Undecaprenyl-diphosphatase n=1 Tax=Candidatus Endonucleibacter bathymodioli TaxID=539814 RepID=A0AA90SD68_9GAMM|nr:undecaprenyl-diphosphate phosphatase [Candidatus Endonucleobacter bathymodioli]
MDFIHVIVLALIQGVTEFLPVSSSAHLILPSQLLGWPDQGLAFDVAVHIGTLAAVIIYFRRDIYLLIRDWLLSLIGKGTTQYSRMAWYVCLATIPAVFFGFLLKSSGLDVSLRSMTVIMATTLIFGALLGIADYFGKCDISLDKASLGQAIMIGFSQVLSLIPGTSRSGITMTAALMLGFTREAAARFSFLLSIPIIMGAGLLFTMDLIKSSVSVSWNVMAGGALLSGVSAMFCIHLFMIIINRIGLMPFVVYRLGLGLFLLFVILNNGG